MSQSPFTPEFQAIFKRAVEIGEQDKDILGAQKYFYDELLKLGQEQRLDNLYRCKDKQTKKKVWFRMNPEQRRYYKKQTRRDKILKPRQIGFTELTIKIGVDNCIFKEGSTEGLMADKKEGAVIELFQRVRDTIDWFSEDWEALIPLKMDKDAANKIIIETAAGRAIKTSYAVSHDFRRWSLTRLHRSETSRMKPDLAKGSAEAVPFSGQIIDETTPRGRDPLFYRDWKLARDMEKRGEVPVWKCHFYSWWLRYPEDGHTLQVPKNAQWDEKEKNLLALGCPPVSLMWRRWKIAESYADEPDKFDEEYPSDDETCFLGGTSVIPRKFILMLDKWVKPPIKRGHLVPKEGWMELIEDERGFISIWEMPKIGEQYVMGIDPSEGVGKDWAGGYVKKRSNGFYVAKIRGQLFPEELAEQAEMLGRMYNSAGINFERNNHGHVLKDRLINIYHYPHIYHQRNVNVIDDRDPLDRVGFTTSRAEKERIVFQLVANLREGKMHPQDEDFLEEATNFQRDDHGRLSAVPGAHDDCFMAACLTEEMDVSLGPYDDAMQYDSSENIEYDEITGYPL